MFKLTKLFTLRPGLPADNRNAFLARLNEASAHSAVIRSLLGPTLEGVINGGDFLWHLQFENEAAYRACLREPRWRHAMEAASSVVAHADSAAYEGGDTGVRAPKFEGGIYRTAFLSVNEATGAELLTQFEAETLAMPSYITVIRSWQLSRVKDSEGARKWSYVWEQEYNGLQDLFGQFSLHPYHWGQVGRWFDRECPEWIVDPRICHTYCAVSGNMITV